MNELSKVLNDSETVMWQGAPSFWPFLFGGSIAASLFGLMWMVFMLPFIGIAVSDIFFGSHFYGFGIFLLPHFWVGLVMIFGIPIYQILVHRRTYYAITDKRVILQTGIIGRDFKTIDFDQVTNSEVNVGLFDKIFGNGNTGSILISTAGSFAYNRQGGMVQKPYALRNIYGPYEAFKFFKQISHDVKADVNYPNKLRPAENPGYETKYEGGASAPTSN